MNQKIRDMITERGMYHDSELYEIAEAVIQECIRCCEQVISDPVPESADTWLNGGSQCIKEIENHFGVK